MGALSSVRNNNHLETLLILIFFLVVFIFFIGQTPLLSPDTFSYLRADINRFPGYIFYLRVLKSVFGASFGSFAIAGHLLLGFVSIFIIYKKCSKLFKLAWVFKLMLMGVLIFPYFYPIEVAVNLTSEGLAYPLYLLLMSLSIDLLFWDRNKSILLIIPVFMLLVLTRGQFVVVGPVLAFIYFLKARKQLFRKTQLVTFLLLLVLPVLTNLADRTYRSIFYGYFETTPYSYVNAITLPLYVSEKNDTLKIDVKDHKNIFVLSHHRIDSMGLLSSKVSGSYEAKYKVFHDNFPKICNQNIHDYGKEYYRNQGAVPPEDSFKIEQACKALFPVLLAANFEEWVALYYTSIVHGFKSVFILFFVIGLALISLWRTFKNYSKNAGFVLFGCLLMLSNAFVVAVASHSIIRYLFYNYFFGLLILIILLKKFIPKDET